MPTPLPGAPPSVLGVVCIRGRILTLLDANALLGQSSAAAHTSIVPLRGDEQIGLAVTGAGDLLEIAANEMKDLSDVNPLILGVIEKAALPISVLNTQQLFATAMRGRERRRRTY
ncbi:MAG: Chemotaxis signal transduction protein [Acidobacteria bacterium]|nr:Chemotaxis signal transduction protein [Acidobacteriota bacterium]